MPLGANANDMVAPVGADKGDIQEQQESDDSVVINIPRGQYEMVLQAFQMVTGLLTDAAQKADMDIANQKNEASMNADEQEMQDYFSKAR